jgi:hypothetical protein
MADKKISALTAATTPLAGSEVLPIVQSGATVKVSVDNLTTGKNVKADSVSVGTTSTVGKVTVNGDVQAQGAFGTLSGSLGVAIGAASGAISGNDMAVIAADAYNNFKDLIIAPRNNGSDVGNTILKSGNLIQGTAAKGINFTANTGAAGMTSQLLNWYEEGTWTPTFAPSSGAFGSVTYNAIQGSRYTRVGNVVHIQGAIATDAITVGTASNNVWITGLPFTAVANTGSTNNGFSDIAIGYSSNFAGDVPSHGYVAAGTTRIELYYRTTANGASAPLNVSDLSTTDKNYVYFSATYICA